MRALATACAGQRRPVPQTGALVLSSGSVALRLTTPDVTPPPGWTVSSHGRTWHADPTWLRGAEPDGRLPFPYPLLVSLGVIGEDRLLLNLAASGGVVSVDGDDELAAGLVASWSRRLTGSPWSAGIRVVRVGFEPDPGFAGPSVPHLSDVAGLLDDGEGGVLFFAGPPNGADLRLVRALAADPARRWTTVVAGATEASWRFVVGMDGLVDTGLLAEPVHLRV